MPSRGFARADVNCDWEMNIADVNAVIGVILSDAAAATAMDDVNGASSKPGGQYHAEA